MKINEFDKTVDELYQLCRRVQKETGRTVAFHFAKHCRGRLPAGRKCEESN